MKLLDFGNTNSEIVKCTKTCFIHVRVTTRSLATAKKACI